MPDAVASDNATLSIPGHDDMDLPIAVGSEGEHAIDVTKLRAQTGCITLDPGYRNTGSVQSSITFIDGEKGILRYRGYAIADLCEDCSFLEVCWLLMFGELPTQAELDQLTALVEKYTAVDADVLGAIRSSGKLESDVEEKLVAALDAFASVFQPSGAGQAA